MRDTEERLRRIWRAAHAMGAAALLAAAAALFASLPARAEAVPPVATGPTVCIDTCLSLHVGGATFTDPFDRKAAPGRPA